MKPQRQSVNAEAGYILLAVLILLALFLVAMAVAAPKIAAAIQRDKEQETIHRGLQYKRAIKLYYKRFGRFPTSIDQLENTNNMRFLRKRYIDPMTGKDDWKPVFFGQAHVKPMGFFNQPIMGPSVAGAAGTSPIGSGSGLGGSSTFGSPGIGSSGIGSTGSSFGAAPGSTQTGSTSSFGGTDPGSGSTTGSSGLGSPGTSSSGSTMGGVGPIVGVVGPSPKASIAIYKLMKHYNEWEFVYFPEEDLLSSGGGMSGGPVNNPGPGLGGSGSGFGGNGNGLGSGAGAGTGSGFGSGFGNSTPTPQPQVPSQPYPPPQ